MTNTRAPGRRYSFVDHGQEGSAFQGDYVLKPVPFAKKYTPTGFGKNRGKHTTVRILPVLNPENPQLWEDFRIPNGSGGLMWGEWVRGYQVATMGEGDTSCSFITHDPVDRDRFDVLNSPPWVLYNAINRAVNSHTDAGGWAGFLKGGQDRGAALSTPKLKYFMPVLILEHSQGPGKPIIGLDDDGVLPILQITAAAGTLMFSQIESIINNPPVINGQPWNINLTDLASGGFVSFYNKADGDPREQRQQSQQPGSLIDRAQQQQAATRDIGFGCYIEPFFHGTAGDLRGVEPLLRKKAHAWEDIINIPSAEQQAIWLSSCFPPDMIMYAFQGHPEWIPESVRARAVAALSVPQPGLPYAQPAMPVGLPYAQPTFQAPQYGLSAQPQFGLPAQPQFGAPLQPQYGLPAQPLGGTVTSGPLGAGTSNFGQSVAAPTQSTGNAFVTGLLGAAAPTSSYVPPNQPPFDVPQVASQPAFGTPPGQLPQGLAAAQPAATLQQLPQQPQFQPQPQPQNAAAPPLQQQTTGQFAPLPQGVSALGAVPNSVAPGEAMAILASLRAGANRT